MFSKIEIGHDWVDYAVFGVIALLVTMVVFSTLELVFAWPTAIMLLLAAACGVGSGFWVIAGEPEDFAKKSKWK